MANFAQQARARFPWMTGTLLNRYASIWGRVGDPQQALAELRQTDNYKNNFKGNFRDDGTLRMDENQYLATKVGMQSAAAEFGFEVDDSQFELMLKREVSAQEFARAAQEAFQRFREPGADKDNGLGQQFLNRFTQTGSANEALEAVRESPKYEKVFAGNLREDGTIRMEEDEYFSYKRGFERAFLSRGLNPRPFEAKGRLADAVRGEMSIDELEGRLNAVEQGLVNNTQETLDFFVEQYGEQGKNFLQEQGDRATALAMAVDPDVGKDVLAQRITTAQIGGEAQLQGFRRNVERAEELARAGIQQSQAREFFGMAAQDLAGIGATTRRFQRGGTTLGNLEDAFLLGQGGEQRRIGRALEAEESSFTSALDIRRDRETGGLSGLLDR